MPEPFGGEFGPVLKEWFRRNEWPQITAERVARAKGSKIGPWASQMSNTMAGKIEPKPNFFVALGWFNEVILTRDFVGITDRRLVDQLKGSEALCHDNGQPFTAVDFFALYLGKLEKPEGYLDDELITQEMVGMWAEGLKLTFAEVCRSLMVPPGAAWKVVAKACADDYGIIGDDLAWVQDVIAGITDPTVEQATRMRAKYGDTQPLINVMLSIINANGGELTEVTQLLENMLKVPIPLGSEVDKSLSRLVS